jgi:hypothetical protein
MEQATTIGLGIAKQVFQVHGADGAGHVLFRKRITRAKLLAFLAAQTQCVVAMEACAGAHALAQVEGVGNPIANTYWGWRLTRNPFAVYQPASRGVGIYQMTDAAFTEAQSYCMLFRTIEFIHPVRARDW